MSRWLLRLAILLGLSSPYTGRADEPKFDPFDQSDVTLEKEPSDPKLAKIVLIAGRQSHGPGDHEFFAGTAILMKMLQQTPGVFPVMVRDGWPKNERVFDNAKAVVFYLDGRNGHPLADPRKLGVIQKLIDQKAGFVCLHYAVDYRPQEGDRVINWMGGYYLDKVSINPHWDGDFQKLPDHPISRGVKPFKIRDEWYYNMKFVPGLKNVTPILTATPPDNTRGNSEAKNYPGRAEIVAWAFDRADGGRGFGFTGGHTHKNWANEDFRRLVTNAILWSARVEVPAAGAKVDMDPNEINKRLDRKGFGKPKK
jgi:type 1 glutamine amidotransferase